jgi:hypothetical protein
MTLQLGYSDNMTQGFEGSEVIGLKFTELTTEIKWS